MTPVEILKSARELISEPTSWAQGFYACSLPNTFGREVKKYIKMSDVVDVHDVSAKCFCSIGAIAKVTGKRETDVFCTDSPEIIALANATGIVSNSCASAKVASFNDENSHEDVLAVFDKAIKSLES